MMNDAFNTSLTIALVIYMVAFGSIGLEHMFGSGWAMVAIAVFMLTGFSIPLLVGTYVALSGVYGLGITLSVLGAICAPYAINKIEELN